MSKCVRIVLDKAFDDVQGEYVFGGTMHFQAAWNDGDVMVYPDREVDISNEIVCDPAITITQDYGSMTYGWRLVFANVTLGKDHDIVFKDLRNLIIRNVEVGNRGQGPDRYMTMNTAEFYQNVSKETASANTANIQGRGRCIKGKLTDFEKFTNDGFDLLVFAFYDDGPINNWYYADVTGSLEDLAETMVANGRTGGSLKVRFYNKMIKVYNSDAQPTEDHIYDYMISFNGSNYSISFVKEPTNNSFD